MTGTLTKARLGRILRGLPANRLGDYLFRLLRFSAIHRRLPKRSSWLLNDVLFFMLTSDEIVRAHRVYITDKEFLKLFVERRLGSQYNVPTLAVLRSPDEVKEYRFPDECVIKPTHLSQHVVRREHGSVVPLGEIETWFSMNYYREQRERNYQSLAPKVMVEPFVFGQHDPTDYKFYCVEGQPRLLSVHAGRRTDHKRTFFDAHGRRQSFSSRHPVDPDAQLPRNFAEMISAARRLSEDFSFVRVDMYSDGQSIAIGEMTNAPTASNGVFQPKEGEKHASATLWPAKHGSKITE